MFRLQILVSVKLIEIKLFRPGKLQRSLVFQNNNTLPVKHMLERTICDDVSIDNLPSGCAHQANEEISAMAIQQRWAVVNISSLCILRNIARILITLHTGIALFCNARYQDERRASSIKCSIFLLIADIFWLLHPCVNYIKKMNASDGQWNHCYSHLVPQPNIHLKQQYELPIESNK